ncbi:hypothetical protein Pint_15340 [Pistacia integerrima]|uniref:Uncharacterized protein n=1 Tax=Pistacia integerrima TaxID=434235 RepID=A0ACC0ZAJ0_9ROSI|nr:hypothetical protein Pint_15340 [Pistacia integerrima]
MVIPDFTSGRTSTTMVRVDSTSGRTSTTMEVSQPAQFWQPRQGQDFGRKLRECVKNAFSKQAVDRQLLDDLAFDLGNQVARNTYSKVEPSLIAEFGALDDFCGFFRSTMRMKILSILNSLSRRLCVCEETGHALTTSTRQSLSVKFMLEIAVTDSEPMNAYGFYPTDEEIIRLLKQKRLDPDFSVQAISETNIYDFEPFELPSLSRIQSDEKWCNFFCAPDYINADTKRVSRATKTGYWKVTGEVRKIKAKRSKEVIGSKRILVFYERPGGSKEIKTNWVMHQFSVDDDPLYKIEIEVLESCFQFRYDRIRLQTIKELQFNQKRSPCISTRNKGEPSHRIAYDNGNPVEDNAYPESQLPKNNSPESQLPPSNSSASNPRYQVTEMPLVMTTMYQILHLATRGKINSVNRRQCFQNEYPCGDTGDSALPPYFNSIESVAGFCSGVSSELDTETFGEWVNGFI